MFKRIEEEVLVKEGKMRNGIYMIAVMLMVLVGCATIGKPSAHALEPKLVWKKETKTEGKQAAYALLAAGSGHVLVHKRDKGEIIAYDKDGNERFHWGPRVDLATGRVAISEDGKYIVFSTHYRQSYLAATGRRVRGYEDHYLRLYDLKSGKELWSKNYYLPYGLRFSPDSTYIIDDSETSSALINTNDGKLIDVYPPKGSYGVGLVFGISPESGYLYARGPSTDEGFIYFLIKRSGELVWEQRNIGRFMSISENAEYISTAAADYVPVFDDDAGNLVDSTGRIIGEGERVEPVSLTDGLVLDRDRNVVLTGEGYLSGNGKRVAMLDNGKTRVLSLPDKAVIKEILVDAGYARFSHDGRYLLLRGAKRGTGSDSDTFIYDLASGTEWEAALDMGFRGLTRDGKYMLLRDSDSVYHFYRVY